VLLLLGAVATPAQMLEDFETGGWSPAAGWVLASSGNPPLFTAASAHDGSFGSESGPSPYGWFRTTTLTPVGNPGEIMSWWTGHFGGTGRTYMGFADNGAGCFSLVYSPNTSDLLLQQNSGYGYSDVASTPFSYTPGVWYRMEVEFLGGGSIEGRLYDSSGTALLASVSYTSAAIVPGQLALRSFGGHYTDTIELLAAVGCAFTTPSSGVTVSGVVPIDFDTTSSTGLPVDALLEFTTDAGTTFTTCTSPGANPMLGLAAPGTGYLCDWDSVADLVGLTAPTATDIRISVTDGTDSGECFVDVTVDNGPSCSLSLLSSPPFMNEIDLEVTGDSHSSPTVDISFEYSVNGGTTWDPATPDGGFTNPMLGVPVTTPTTWSWDSRADGVGLAAVAVGVLVRASVSDGAAAAPGTCLSTPFDVDNTALCPGACGDCDLNGVTPTIVDALLAAQIAAGLVTPTTPQTGCCDVNSSTAVEVLDALLIAQDSAGITVTMTCL
jgi:hypothetical protein